MKADSGTLLLLVAQFAGLSLVAVGGINAVLPEMHRQTVELAHLLTDRQFAELFAIAQAAPGPHMAMVAVPFAARLRRCDRAGHCTDCRARQERCADDIRADNAYAAAGDGARSTIRSASAKADQDHGGDNRCRFH